jgi:hypothetical protein
MRLQQVGRFVAANDYDRDRAVACGGHLFAWRGASAKRRQQSTEARLAATSQYVTEKG